MIEELLTAFAEDGPDVGAEEVADILWLAARVDAAAPSIRAGTSDSGPPLVDDDVAAPVPARHAAQAPREPQEQLFPAARAVAAAPEGDGGRWGVPLRVGRATTLHDPLSLMRSLRPIGRRAIGGSGDRLDEQATVERSIEQMLLSPVLLPAESSWLDLALVVDAHHSMLLWADLVDELRQVLTRSGVFRDVRTWYLSGTEDGGTPLVAHRRGAAPRSPSEIADPSGRRLILVVTDTVADGWRGGGPQAVLRHWSAHNAVAVLNVLPERLWTRAAVQPVSLWLRADRPASATRSWRRAAAHRARRRRTRATATGTSPAVPMVSASPESLRRLARLTSGDASWQRMACLRLDTGPALGSAPARPRAADPASGGLAAVERFRAGASPTAQQLAAYLAAVPLTLPVMTLVRRSLLPDSEHGHLAEVALGGLFQPWGAASADTAPDDLTFDFLPGVRDALLGSQLRSDVATVREVVRQSVWEYLDRHRGSVREFTATRVARGTGGPRRVDADAQSFAEQRPLDGPGQGEAGTAAALPETDRWTGLSGRLVVVEPHHQEASVGGGLLLTPRLVLACLVAPATPRGTSPLVRVDGRTVTSRVVWSEFDTPGAALLLADEDVIDPRTWAERNPRPLRWGDLVPGTPVRVDAFSEVGDLVKLDGEVHPGPDGFQVEITAPHPTTGWPQLNGALLSHDGVFTGLVVRRRRTSSRPIALAAQTLRVDARFREVLERYMDVPYGLEDPAVGDMPLCLAVEVKVITKRAGQGADPARSERAVAEVLTALMQDHEVDGVVTRRGGRLGPDLIVSLDPPFSLRALRRLLAELPDRLATADAFSGLSPTLGVAVAAGEVEEGVDGPEGAAVREAVLMSRDEGFRHRLARTAGGGGLLLLAVSSYLHRRIIELLGSNWQARFVPFGGTELAPGGWFFLENPDLLGRALDQVEADHSPAFPGLAERRCGSRASDSDTARCAGRAVPESDRCLAHLPPGGRADYLSTLEPGASVDFSGTSFSLPLLGELLAAVTDPEGNHVRLGDAVFREAVFPDGCDFRDVEFSGDALFDRATFLGRAHFSGARFTEAAVFDRAVFSGPADFDRISVDDRVSMARAVFESRATFVASRIDGFITLAKVAFRGPVSFEECHFVGEVLYDDSHFGEAVSWRIVRFDGTSSFADVAFRGPVNFNGARFHGRTSFDRARSFEVMSFGEAHFRGLTSFREFRFERHVDFSGAVFEGRVDVSGSRLGGALTGSGPPTGRASDGHAAPDAGPRVPDRSRPATDLRGLIAAAEAVLIAFDGPVCRLFAGHPLGHLTGELVRWADERGVRQALLELDDTLADPYDLLDAVARRHPGSDVVIQLEELLTQEELRAVASAPPTAYADPLIRTWRTTGTRLAVTARCSTAAARTYLSERGLLSCLSGIYGRAPAQPFLSMEPPAVDRAVEALGLPAENVLVIGSAPADLTASRAADVPFLGYTHDGGRADAMRSAGADLVVSSLQPVLETVRELFSDRSS